MDVVALQLGDFAHLYGVDLAVVILACLHGVQSGVGARDEGPHNFVDTGVVRPPPVVVVAHDPDILPGLPLYELEGAGADQLVSAVEGHVVDDLLRRHVSQDVLGEDGLEEAGVVSTDTVPSEDDRMVVGHETVDDCEVQVPVVHGRALA